MDAPRAPAAPTMLRAAPLRFSKQHAEPANALVRDPAISSIAVRAAPAHSDPGLRLHGGRGKSQRPTAAADQTSARGHGSGRDPSIGSYRIPAMSGVLRRPPASASTGSLPVRNELGHVGTVSVSTATIRMQVSRPGWVLALLFVKSRSLYLSARRGPRDLVSRTSRRLGRCRRRWEAAGSAQNERPGQHRVAWLLLPRSSSHALTTAIGVKRQCAPGTMPPLRSRQAVAAPAHRYLRRSAIVLAAVRALLSARSAFLRGSADDCIHDRATDAGAVRVALPTPISGGRSLLSFARSGSCRCRGPHDRSCVPAGAQLAIPSATTRSPAPSAPDLRLRPRGGVRIEACDGLRWPRLTGVRRW